VLRKVNVGVKIMHAGVGKWKVGVRHERRDCYFYGFVSSPVEDPPSVWRAREGIKEWAKFDLAQPF